MTIQQLLTRLTPNRANLFRRLLPLALIGACSGGLWLLLPNGEKRHQIITHEVVSNYQAERTQIRVLFPEILDSAERYRVVYVLPVSAHLTEQREYGDALLELQRLGLHNRHKVVFVKPTFAATPWYADHPSNGSIRQESHMLRFVLPFVEGTYPTAKTADARLVLGFSKSGWGAWSMLLRHPHVFGRALAWDAPMMLERVGPWDTSTIFGTQENFESYRLSDLVRTHGARLGPAARLFMHGHGVFREDHARMGDLLRMLKIPHEYIDGPLRKHDWRSGWIADAVHQLVSRTQLPL
jgi:Putative esterase